jgi:hypothetical protein
VTSRIVAALGVLLLLLLTGCAADPAGESTGHTTTEVLPSAPLNCPNFVTEVVTGPAPTNVTEDGPLAQAQQRLSDDIEAATAYGNEHPDDFGSIRFENSPSVRIVIGFTDHLDEHCAALRDILAYPDEFELVLEEATQTQLAAIQRDVSVMAGDRLLGSGQAANTVSVMLRADGEAVAAAIAEKYGDLVEISVGALPYPDPGTDNRCSDLVPPPPSEPTSLVATLRPISGVVRVGHHFDAVVTVTNTGGESTTFESGSPLTALVYAQGAGEVVGIFTGGIAGVGVGAELGPGESIDIEVVGGTASCDPALGYALPPADYEVRVPVEQYEYSDGGFELHAILSDAVTLTVSE